CTMLSCGVFDSLRPEFLLVRARIERFYLPADSIRMRGQRIFIEIPPRARLMVEVALAIKASNQRCGIAHFQLLDVGWDVADREPDPAIVRPARLRGAHQPDVLHGALAPID